MACMKRHIACWQVGGDPSYSKGDGARRWSKGLRYSFQFDLSTHNPHSLVASWTSREFSPLPCACETPFKGHLYPLQSLYQGPALHRRVLPYVLLRFVELLGQVLGRSFAGYLDHGQLLAITCQVAGHFTHAVLLVFLH